MTIILLIIAIVFFGEFVFSAIFFMASLLLPVAILALGLYLSFKVAVIFLSILFYLNK